MTSRRCPVVRSSGSVRVEQAIVSRMMPNPEPLKSIWTLLGERAVVKADSCGIENTSLLKSDRRVPWIGFEEGEALVGERLNVIRKLAVVKPKVRVGKVVQSGVQRPAS